MNLNKLFYIETEIDGDIKIYDVGLKFFPRNETDSILEQFNPSQTSAKNTFIRRLKKEGWMPLSLEDIRKTSVNECGLITT